MFMTPHKIIFWEVDPQADFLLPGGKLYVPGAEKIIPNLNRLVEEARKGRVFLISHGCQHAPDDPEFQTFPPHCIRGTAGARLIPEALTDNFCIIPNEKSFRLTGDLLKNQQVVFEKQELDVFSNPHAAVVVELLGKDAEFYVFGVVTEYCVLLAANGLLDRKRKVFIVRDAIETLDPKEGSRTLEELKALGARIVSTDEALAAVRDENTRAASE
jgi:nicotinamidase/pyrazinamidase